MRIWLRAARRYLTCHLCLITCHLCLITCGSQVPRPQRLRPAGEDRAQPFQVGKVDSSVWPGLAGFGRVADRCSVRGVGAAWLAAFLAGNPPSSKWSPKFSSRRQCARLQTRIAPLCCFRVARQDFDFAAATAGRNRRLPVQMEPRGASTPMSSVQPPCRRPRSRLDGCFLS